MNENAAPAEAVMDVELVKCECCGLKEECTPAYIAKVRERFSSHWICGLCSEAVKEELVKAEGRISMEEAMETHMAVCKRFKRSSPTVNLADAMLQLMRRSSFESPRGSPTSPTPSSPVAPGRRIRLGKGVRDSPTLSSIAL